MRSNKKENFKYIFSVAEREANKKLKRRLTVKGVLSFIVIGCIVRQFFTGSYENVFLGILTLLLFNIPFLIDRHLKIDIPPLLESIILFFIFAAEILGEVDSFYTRYPYWDTLLHTLNGFLMSAVGFCLVDVFNRSDRFSIRLSPSFLAIVAFCFSMTIGVLWEFFEYGMDLFFATDMQKDFIINNINSVKFDPDGLNIVRHIEIKSLLVNGEDWIERFGGYIDIGLLDTVKDLFVNFIGAVVFSVIGFFYVKNRGEGEFAKKFIPVVKQ